MMYLWAVFPGVLSQQSQQRLTYRLENRKKLSSLPAYRKISPADAQI